VAHHLQVQLPAAGVVARLAFTGRDDGDLRIDTDPAVLSARQRAVVDAPWAWGNQVHGTASYHVARPGEFRGDVDADALTTRALAAPIAVRGADCPIVVLVGEAGAVGAVHAGWRGLAAGVLERAVAALRARSAGSLRAWLGPCIGPECYEFGASQLAALTPLLGEAATAATTAAGTPALDLVAGVRHRLEAVDVPLDRSAYHCTACGAERYFSHRARQERGRQAAVVWLEPA
jgi:hypothetical protein